MSAAAEAHVRIRRRSRAGAPAPIRPSWLGRDALSAGAPAGLPGRRRSSFASGALPVAGVEGLRLRSLRAAPRAPLVALEGERGSHAAPGAEGPVVLHEGAELRAAVGGLEPGATGRRGGAPGRAAALVELRPERVLSYASRAGG